jgi:hypothetical protein
MLRCPFTFVDPVRTHRIGHHLKGFVVTDQLVEKLFSIGKMHIVISRAMDIE